MSGKKTPNDWCKTGEVLLTTNSVKPTTAAIVTIKAIVLRYSNSSGIKR